MRGGGERAPGAVLRCPDSLERPIAWFGRLGQGPSGRRRAESHFGRRWRPSASSCLPRKPQGGSISRGSRRSSWSTRSDGTSGAHSVWHGGPQHLFLGGSVRSTRVQSGRIRQTNLGPTAVEEVSGSDHVNRIADKMDQPVMLAAWRQGARALQSQAIEEREAVLSTLSIPPSSPLPLPLLEKRKSRFPSLAG